MYPRGSTITLPVAPGVGGARNRRFLPAVFSLRGRERHNDLADHERGHHRRTALSGRPNVISPPGRSAVKPGVRNPSRSKITLVAWSRRRRRPEARAAVRAPGHSGSAPVSAPATKRRNRLRSQPTAVMDLSYHNRGTGATSSFWAARGPSSAGWPGARRA